MRKFALIILLVLAACARAPLVQPGTQPDGTPTGATYPQTADQCAAQPDSAWCKPR